MPLKVEFRKRKPLATCTKVPENYDDCVLGPGSGEKHEMTEIERAKLVEVAQAMSPDEIEVFLNTIPAEVIMKHMELELKKARAFTNAVNTAMNILEQ